MTAQSAGNAAVRDFGEFRHADGNDIPYSDGTFDIVCSMGVLHHVEYPRPTPAEIVRTLRPGGQLILMLYHRDSWKYRVVLPLRRVLDPGHRGKTLQQAVNRNDGAECPLARVYSRAELRALLTRFSNICFAINQLDREQLLLLPRLVWPSTRALPSCSESIFARHFGWNLYVHAVRP